MGAHHAVSGSRPATNTTNSSDQLEFQSVSDVWQRSLKKNVSEKSFNFTNRFCKTCRRFALKTQPVLECFLWLAFQDRGTRGHEKDFSVVGVIL